MSNLTRTQRAALADLEASGELFAAERPFRRADPTAGHRYSTTTLQALVDAGHATVWSGDADSHVSHVYAGVKVKLAPQLSPVEEVHSTHIAPLTIPAAMFVDVVEHAMTGEPMIYAHCGCGMEYELDPDAGVLTYWHDAVGQESSTTLSSPNAWITFIEVGHADCESDDDVEDVEDVEPIHADPTAPAFSQAVNAYASTVSPSAAEIMAEIPPAEEVNADVIAAFASQGMAWPNVRPSHLAEAIAVVRMQLEILENARPLEDLLAADFHLIDTVRIVSALCNLLDGGEKR